MLTESLLLSLIGGTVGVLVGWGGLRIFLAMASERFPRMDETAIDGNVLLFTLAVSLLTGILFGLAPAWRATRLNLVTMLKEGAAANRRVAAATEATESWPSPRWQWRSCYWSAPGC